MTAPLVLLHGYTGGPAAWDAVAARLEDDGARVLRPALLGHDGGVPPPLPAGAAPFETEVDRLAAELRRAGTAGAHLAGYSLGGRVALGLLVRHGDLWSRATLLGAHPGLASERERRRRAAEDAVWIALLRRQGLEAFVAAWETRPLFASQADLPSGVLRDQAALRRRHHPEGLAAALERLGLGVMPDWRPHLGGVSVPVTVVAGERDGRFLALAREMAALLPRARLVELAGVGHNPLVEDPAAVAGILSRKEEA